MRSSEVTFTVERGRWYRAVVDGKFRVRFCFTATDIVYMAWQGAHNQTRQMKAGGIYYGKDSLEFTDLDSQIEVSGVMSKATSYTLTEIKPE